MGPNAQPNGCGWNKEVANYRVDELIEKEGLARETISFAQYVGVARKALREDFKTHLREKERLSTFETQYRVTDRGLEIIGAGHDGELFHDVFINRVRELGPGLGVTVDEAELARLETIEKSLLSGSSQVITAAGKDGAFRYLQVWERGDNGKVKMSSFDIAAKAGKDLKQGEVGHLLGQLTNGNHQAVDADNLLFISKTSTQSSQDIFHKSQVIVRSSSQENKWTDTIVDTKRPFELKKHGDDMLIPDALVRTTIDAKNDYGVWPIKGIIKKTELTKVKPVSYIDAKIDPSIFTTKETHKQRSIRERLLLILTIPRKAREVAKSAVNKVRRFVTPETKNRLVQKSREIRKSAISFMSRPVTKIREYALTAINRTRRLIEKFYAVIPTNPVFNVSKIRDRRERGGIFRHILRMKKDSSISLGMTAQRQEHSKKKELVSSKFILKVREVLPKTETISKKVMLVKERFKKWGGVFINNIDFIWKRKVFTQGSEYKRPILEVRKTPIVRIKEKIVFSVLKFNKKLFSLREKAVVYLKPFRLSSRSARGRERSPSLMRFLTHFVVFEMTKFVFFKQNLTFNLKGLKVSLMREVFGSNVIKNKPIQKNVWQRSWLFVLRDWWLGVEAPQKVIHASSSTQKPKMKTQGTIFQALISSSHGSVQIVAE